MKYLNLILAALLLLCLAPMPYGYYSLVRFVAMVAFARMAYQYYVQGKEGLAWAFSALAALFQPFFKIALGRGVWNVVDVLVTILLLVLFVLKQKRQREE